MQQSLTHLPEYVVHKGLSWIKTVQIRVQSLHYYHILFSSHAPVILVTCRHVVSSKFLNVILWHIIFGKNSVCDRQTLIYSTRNSPSGFFDLVEHSSSQQSTFVDLLHFAYWNLIQCIFLALWPDACNGLFILDVCRSHTMTQQIGKILWTSDQLVAETPTWQHTTVTINKYPCLRWDL